MVRCGKESVTTTKKGRLSGDHIIRPHERANRVSPLAGFVVKTFQIFWGEPTNRICEPRPRSRGRLSSCLSHAAHAPFSTNPFAGLPSGPPIPERLLLLLPYNYTLQIAKLWGQNDAEPQVFHRSLSCLAG